MIEHELNQALSDSIQQFRKEFEEIIIAYDKSIAELKTRIAKETEENAGDNRLITSKLSERWQE